MEKNTQKPLIVEIEEAKQEIVRLHEQAMGYVSQLGLPEEAINPLRNYAAALIGRNK